MSDERDAAPGMTAARGPVVMDPEATVRRIVPVAKLDTPVTPTEDVYVIAHMGIAQVDVDRWRLTVDGLVEHPLELEYLELTSLPSRAVTAVIECFGNPVEPDVATRRVGNVVWRGVPLADVLARAGVRAGADAVWLEGLDSGTFAGVSSDRYLKDVPLARALESDVLLAWAMNGVPLTAEHGFPVRVFVPGYFGTNHVKWLSRIHVAVGRPDSFFTTRLYNRRVIVGGRTVVQPVRELDVHSVIVAPGDGARLVRGQQVVTGWAWGAWEIARVEVSWDRGATWREAQVGPRESAQSWRRFTMAGTLGTPGAHEIACRATDVQGRTQPAEGRNRTHVVSVTVV